MPDISKFQYKDKFRGYPFRPITEHRNVEQQKTIADLLDDWIVRRVNLPLEKMG